MGDGEQSCVAGKRKCGRTTSRKWERVTRATFFHINSAFSDPQVALQSFRQWFLPVAPKDSVVRMPRSTGIVCLVANGVTPHPAVKGSAPDAAVFFARLSCNALHLQQPLRISQNHEMLKFSQIGSCEREMAIFGIARSRNAQTQQNRFFPCADLLVEVLLQKLKVFALLASFVELV